MKKYNLLIILGVLLLDHSSGKKHSLNSIKIIYLNSMHGIKRPENNISTSTNLLQLSVVMKYVFKIIASEAFSGEY